MSGETTGLATAVACGVMLAASFDLVHDGALPLVLSGGDCHAGSHGLSGSSMTALRRLRIT